MEAPMAASNLAVYLNDHLAGSVAGIELVADLESAHAKDALGPVLGRLRAEIEADQKTLEGLMERLGVGKSVPRRVAGWLAEKAAQLKLLADDPSGGPLRRLEALEALVLGITGK